MANTPIRDITQSGTPTGSSFIVFDDGTMKKGTVAGLADGVRPVASQSEAETGSDNAKTMTPVRVKQSIASEVGVSVASKEQGDLANSAVQDISAGDGIAIDSSTPTAPSVALDSDTLASLSLANSAIQSGDLGALATKDKIDAITDIDATGTPDTTTFMRGDGSWSVPTGSGLGDVTGPSTSSDSFLAAFDGSTGKVIKEISPDDFISGASASQTEAEGGTSTNKGMTPLRSAQSIAARAPYADVASAEAATVPADRVWIETLGMDSLGNEAPSTWKEVDSPPADGAYITDVNGRIFDIFVKATPPNLMQFGGSYYSTANNTPALLQMLSVCKRQNLQWCQIPPGDFIFTEWPGDLGDYNVMIEGAGRDRTKLYRAYDEGTDDRGLLHFSNGRVKLSGMTILPKSGNKGGSAITLYTTSSTQVDTATLEDIRITSGTIDGWKIGLNIDGQYKTTGAVGVRNTNIDYLEIFGCELYAARIISCTLLSWMGGFTSSNVGTGEAASGDILIGGVSSVPAHYFNLNLAAISGDLLLQDYAQVGTITCPHFGGDIVNTANVSTVMTIGNVTGSVQQNWSNSQHVNTIRGNGTDGTWTWRDLGNNDYEVWRSVSLTTSNQTFNLPSKFSACTFLYTFFAPLSAISVACVANGSPRSLIAVGSAAGSCVIGARVKL